MNKKMKKFIRFLLIFSVVLSIFPTNSISFAETANQTTVKTMMGQGYEESILVGFSDKYYLNPHIYNEQQKIVYIADNSSTDYKNLIGDLPENQGDNNFKDGDYRYLGYNASGELVANGLFEPDVSPFSGI